ncbi:MAG: mechanosensitive ion channel family protein [Candidatus Krumholzibacteria bacterium]|nr:mechanosensitive ion channel family protein [Candidatus Krumholzibacteria bacterium]
MEEFLELAWKWLITSGAKILAIIIISFILIRVVRMVISRSKARISLRTEDNIEAAKRTETLTGLVERTVRALVLTAAALMVLQSLGINIGPLLAGAGVVGLAVGFGAQSLVKDVISGFFILIENHMNVGDVVEISGKSGVVESINMRVTTLRDYSGSVHVIPNGQIAVLTNMTKEFSRAVFEIGVAYKENVDEVMQVMKDVAEDMTGDPEWSARIYGPMEMAGLDSFGDSSVNIKARIETQPREQWNVAREYRRRLKNVFDEKGIEIPFPHVTLYAGEGKNEGVLKIRSVGDVKD